MPFHQKNNLSFLCLEILHLPWWEYKKKNSFSSCWNVNISDNKSHINFHIKRWKLFFLKKRNAINFKFCQRDINAQHRFYIWQKTKGFTFISWIKVTKNFFWYHVNTSNDLSNNWHFAYDGLHNVCLSNIRFAYNDCSLSNLLLT